MKLALKPQMSVRDFDTGYWYALELKAFARLLGIKGASKLRKDQLEVHIRHQLGGQPKRPATKFTSRGDKQARDALGLDNSVVNYISDKRTKQFILQQAEWLCPALPAKSGRWYWLNRWREQQLQQNRRFCYLDLVQEFVRLCTSEGRLPQIPSARFNNFVSDFLAAGLGSRDDALAAWQQLKKLDIPKTFVTWQSRK